MSASRSPTLLSEEEQPDPWDLPGPTNIVTSPDSPAAVQDLSEGQEQEGQGHEQEQEQGQQQEEDLSEGQEQEGQGHEQEQEQGQEKEDLSEGQEQKHRQMTARSYHDASISARPLLRTSSLDIRRPGHARHRSVGEAAPTGETALGSPVKLVRTQSTVTQLHPSVLMQMPLGSSSPGQPPLKRSPSIAVAR
jgi:hypothetical protein